MSTQTQARIPEIGLSDRLRLARVKMTGLSTREFAELIGVSQKTINNAESGTHQVRKIVLNAWSLATGVPVCWLKDGIVPQDGDPEGQPVPFQRRAGSVTEPYPKISYLHRPAPVDRVA